MGWGGVLQQIISIITRWLMSKIDVGNQAFTERYWIVVYERRVGSGTCRYYTIEQLRVRLNLESNQDTTGTICRY